MVWAASSAAIKAAVVPISGFAAPARTATPTPDEARSARLPGLSVPEARKASMSSLAMIKRSKGSPAAMRFFTSTVPVKLVVTLCPVARSKSGSRSR